MKILDYITATDLKSQKQVEQAALLCYYHYKTTGENIFDMKGIQELFSDAGFCPINSSRVRKGLINSKIMRVPKTMKTSLEFVPATLQDYEKCYSSIWNDTTTINSGNELIDETKFCGKRSYLDRLIKQINCSYGNNCYDATAVLMRRLFEILLILSYQNLGIDNEIKDSSDSYVMLEKIVKNAVKNQRLKLSRIKNNFDEFRQIGNFSAHSITYTAGQKDIDDIRLNYRAMLEELYNKSGLI